MKKIFAIILGTLLIMGFAASAFAIHAEIPAETQAVVAKGSTQITIGGELRYRGWYRKNLQTTNKYAGSNDTIVVPTSDLPGTIYDTNHGPARLGVKGASYAWSDYRVRLSIDAKISPNVQGFVQLESDFGTNDKWTYGSGGPNSKPNEGIDFLQAWILYTGSGLFGFPAGLKVGHMPLKLSYGDWFDWTQEGSDAIVFFMDPTKSLHIGLLTFKVAEQTSTITRNNFDIDGYAALLIYKINENHTVGVNYALVNWSDAGMDQQNLGVHADGKFGNFGYQAEFNYQFGNVFDGETDELGTCPGPLFNAGAFPSANGWTSCAAALANNYPVITFDDAEHEYSGWSFRTKLNYKINSVNLRAQFGYGSGDDDAFDGEIDEFMPWVGTIQNIAFIYEYQHATTAFYKNPQPTGTYAAGLANTTVYNLGVDWQATKDLGLSLDGFLFRASETGAQEDFIRAPWGVGPLADGISKSAGWEIDAKIKYQLAKNLVYQIDAGYFKPGDYYEDYYGQWLYGPGAPGFKDKGAYVFRHLIQLNF